MKIKSKTGYKIALYTFVTLTVASYMWALYSIIVWIIKALATTKRGYTTKDGRQIPERTEWHNVVLQNGLAKVANQYVKKGDKLYIEGELRTRSYDDAQGVKRYVTEIVATDMEMLTPKATGAGAQVPPPPVPDAPAPDGNDDLPF